MTKRQAVVELVAMAIDPQWFSESGKVLCNYPNQDKNYQKRARKHADAAITAFLEAAAEQGWRMRQDLTGTGPAAATEFEWDK